MHSNKQWLESSKRVPNVYDCRRIANRQVSASGSPLKRTLAALFLIAVGHLSLHCMAQALPSAPAPGAVVFLSHPQSAIAALEEPPAYSSSASSAPASMGIYGNARLAPKPKTADTKFLIWNGLDVGMAVIDVELTQHCIANGQCREGNPLMPSSHAGQLSVGIGYATLGAFVSYKLKKHKSSYWWLPVAGGIAGHTAGLAAGLAHK